MLTEKQINDNKNRYLSLLDSVHREGIKELASYLENECDFFIAPASTKYHGNFKGGLCAHCLYVYDILNDLVEKYCKDEEIGYESIVVAALLHDMQKINYYEPTSFNKKEYSPYGSKSDEVGKFDWVSVMGYKIIEEPNRFIYGNHEETCEFIARQFIPMSVEESAAILHHMGGLGFDSVKEGLNEVYRRYHLALLLHIADTMAAILYC